MTKEYLNCLFVVIMGLTFGVSFKGFMIQARKAADDSPVGMFASDSPNFKAQCNGNVRLCAPVAQDVCISHVLCMYVNCLTFAYYA